MKGKIRKPVILVFILLVIVASGVFIHNYLNDAMDYSRTLVAGKGPSQQVMSEVTASKQESTKELEKIQSDINSLKAMEQKEDQQIAELLTPEYIEETSGSKAAKPETTEKSCDTPKEPDTFQLSDNSPQNLRTQSEQETLVNILFLGLDRSLDRDDTLGVYRTDAISLASLNLDTNKLEVLSIPRDTYVYIPKIEKKDKINHAYVWGGMGDKGIASTIETVNRFLKYYTVNYYFCIDMEPVAEIVDLLGGVELDVEVDMKTHGFNLSKGLQLLNGEKAVQYIKWRYSGAGDIDRVKRQQKFCLAMINKLKQMDQLTNAIKIILKYNKYIKTNMNLKQMLGLSTFTLQLKEADTKCNVISGKSAMINKTWYWLPDEKATDKLLREMFKIDS